MPAEPADLLDAARGLVPVLRAREQATIAGRRIPPETIADFHRAGILRILQPRRFGGHQMSFGVFSEIVEVLTEGCSSSAWIYAVLAEHQWIIGCMPEAAQQDVWGEDQTAVASSSLAPRETARAVPGGWQLSGRFPFSSGCLNVTWAIIGAHCEDEAGASPTRYLLVPMSEIEIVDDWEALGLRGTGSMSLVLRDVFIPSHRSVLLRDLYDGSTPGATVHPDYPVLRAPRGLLVPFSLGVVMFALGRRALDTMAASLRNRLSRGTRVLSESEFVQQQLGEAAAEIETAILIMRTHRAQTVAFVDTGAEPPREWTMRNRRDIAFAASLLRRGVERLVELGGSRGVYDHEPVSRYWRDILTISTHAAVSRHLAMVPYGRALLGLPPPPGEA